MITSVSIFNYVKFKEPYQNTVRRGEASFRTENILCSFVVKSIVVRFVGKYFAAHKNREQTDERERTFLPTNRMEKSMRGLTGLEVRPKIVNERRKSSCFTWGLTLAPFCH